MEDNKIDVQSTQYIVINFGIEQFGIDIKYVDNIIHVSWDTTGNVVNISNVRTVLHCTFLLFKNWYTQETQTDIKNWIWIVFKQQCVFLMIIVPINIIMAIKADTTAII